MLGITTNMRELKPPSCAPGSGNPCQEATSLQIAIFYIGIYMYTLGVGGVKAGVSAFGTGQFDRQNEKEKVQMEDFFNRFFVIINTGGLLAVTFVLYVMQNVGTSWGHGTCSVLFLVALFVFVFGTKKYRYKELKGNPIVQILQVFVAAVRKRNFKLPSSPSSLETMEA